MLAIPTARRAATPSKAQAKLGLADKGNFFLWIGGTLVLAVAFYYGATAVRRRQGVALERVYSEIPPE